VVRLPESANAAPTFVPFVLTASERGFYQTPRVGQQRVRAGIEHGDLVFRAAKQTLPPANTTSAGSSLT
jgi:hypothetical protein